MPPPEPAPTFGDALHEAIGRRGLPLARVSARLAAAGYPVAQSTLSQWQRGRRLPRSPRSLSVVDELEAILDAPRGSLRSLAEAENAGGMLRARAVPVAVQASAIDEVVAELGVPARDMLSAISSHDVVEIGPTGCHVRRRTTMTMEAIGRTDRHVVAHTVDPGTDVSKVRFVGVRGCRLGRVVTVPEIGLAATELHFDRRLSPGDTVAFEFVVEDSASTLSPGYFRWVTQTQAVVAVEIVFDRDSHPSTVAGYERDHADAPADRMCEELPLERGDRVHLVRSPADRGIHGIRWTWPSWVEQA